MRRRHRRSAETPGRELRRPPWLTAVWLALAAAAVATSIAAQEVAVEADGTSLADGTLDLRLSVPYQSAEPIDIEILLDGRSIARRELASGDHELHLEAGRLGAGSHRVEVVTPAGSASTTVTVIPPWFSILPPLIAIALALLFKNVIPSLFLGVFTGALALHGWNPVAALFRTVDTYVLNAMTDPSRAQILLFSILLGGMVAVVAKSGGTQGIVERISRFATSSRRGQLATWVMGVLIFFDDYANTLIVGSTMRPISDRLRISREKLAYIVDSTAAPIASISPISTWIGFEIGLLASAFAASDLPFNAYGIFLASIPFRFYVVLALVLGFTIAFTQRDFGPMLAAERRAAASGEVIAEGDVALASFSEEALAPDEGAPKRAINAFLPILTVIVGTAVGLYVSGNESISRADFDSGFAYLREVFAQSDPYVSLVWASLAGVVMALGLGLSQRVMSVRGAFDALVEGFKSMIMAFSVLLLAWSLGDVCTKLDTADYLVHLATGVLRPEFLPIVVFVLSAAVAFATGTSWGVMGILTPLSVPLAKGLSLEAGLALDGGDFYVVLVGTVAAVLAGSVWGDHCSPISDTTILSSMASGSDHIAHVRTQLPYALAAGLVGIVLCQLPAAYGLHPLLALLIGGAALVAAVRFLGKTSEAPAKPNESGAGA